jgi:hypothetical protein
MGLKFKKGEEIDKEIINTLKKEEHPVSTRGLALKTKISWHSIINHCLRLQMAKKIDGFKIGNLNVWVMKNE